jgi:hypothetical protein
VVADFPGKKSELLPCFTVPIFKGSCLNLGTSRHKGIEDHEISSLNMRRNLEGFETISQERIIEGNDGLS